MKFRMVAAAGLLLLTNPAWALGLGELDLQSALNERFRATIELYDAAQLELSEIRVSLATTEDFERVGVERFFFLTSLKFEVVSGPRGVPEIKVTSTQAISEPYLNFIVEVLWPNGRMLREYTVLLDPPTFTQAAAPDVAPPARTPPVTDRGGSGNTVPPSRSPSASRSSAARSASGGATRAATGDDRTLGMTGRNDTAWKLAEQSLPAEDITVQQQMLAIKRLNPQAFINDNVNQLKAGYVLRTPTAAEARALTPAEAQQRVVLENDAWRSGRTLPTQQVAETETPALKAQIDATRSGTAPAAAAPESGQLRIVAEAGDSAQGTAETTSAEAGVTGGTGADTEERDRLAREVEALTYKMDRELEQASEQLAVKDRQLDVQNQEITTLQSQLETLKAELQRMRAEQAAAQPASAPEAGPWWTSTTALAGGAVGVIALAVAGLFVARRRREAAEAAYYDEADAALDPAAFEDAAPIIAAGEADEPWVAEAAEPVADPLAIEDEPLVATFDDEVADEEAPGSDDTADESGVTGDVVGEAEIYIAYGRYPQAVSLLTGALNADPDRHDVRCKLLELYAETNDRESFDAQRAELASRCSDASILGVAESLISRFEDGGDEISLEDLEAAEGDASAAAETDALASLELEDLETADAGGPTLDLSDADLDLSDALDDVDDEDALRSAYTPDAASSNSDDEFELDLDLDLDATELGNGEARDVSDDAELDLDFDTELSESGTVSDDASASDAPLSVGSASDQLGGDLGLDFDPDRDAAEDSPAATGNGQSAIGLEEDLLDLDDVLKQADDEFGEQLDELADAELAEQPSDTAPETNGEPTAAVQASDASDARADNVLTLDTNGAAQEPTQEPTVAELDDAAEESEDDFDFDLDGDSASTKLDLARAYIDMGDQDGARDILNEVLSEGSQTQQQEAQELLESI
ncbi:MAG: FimV/HubP family polar landmark protein [Pseudomonadota bacterium]